MTNMYVIYSPEDGDGQRWEFDPKRVRVSQAEKVERLSGENWDAWLAAVQSGSIRARRVLLWYLLVQDHPKLRFEDTPDFYAGELVVEHSLDELVEMREMLMDAKLPESQREQFLPALDAEIEKAKERSGTPEPSGKAPSKRAG